MIVAHQLLHYRRIMSSVFPRISRQLLKYLLGNICRALLTVAGLNIHSHYIVLPISDMVNKDGWCIYARIVQSDLYTNRNFFSLVWNALNKHQYIYTPEFLMTILIYYLIRV